MTADADALPPQLQTKLDKLKWQRECFVRGLGRNDMSPELSEALRTEIRTALDAGGKPFDVNIARRVYDLAIAARDMCVAASSSVKEAVDQIKDTDGPMETLDSPGTPESQAQVSETFGARLIRELLAIVPSFARPGAQDPRELVHALAEARGRGMHDVAAELEKKLFGRELTGPRPVVVPAVAVNLGGFDHGFADGRAGAPSAHPESPDYERGYKEGLVEHYLEPTGRPEDAAACPACGHPPGDSCDGPMSHPARRIAYESRARQLPPPPSPGYEHAVKDQTPCGRCGHFRGDHWPRCTIARLTGMAGEAAWVPCACEAFVDAAGNVDVNTRFDVGGGAS